MVADFCNPATILFEKGYLLMGKSKTNYFTLSVAV